MKSQGIFNFLLSGNPAVLHLHLGVLFPYCFCFQICTYIFTTQLPNLNFSLCCSTQQLYFHIYLFCSHNWTSIVGNTTFVPTPIRVLFCVFFTSAASVPTASPRLRVHLYYFALVSTHSYLLNLHHHCPLYYICTCKFMYLFFHIDICISILTSQALLMVLTFTHVTKIYLKRLFFKHVSEGQNLESIFKRHPVEQNIV